MLSGLFSANSRRKTKSTELKVNTQQFIEKSAMLNKLEFNNLVISNKKEIQKIRIQVINRLVRKIKSLRKQLEEGSRNDKFKERLRKTLETLEHVKRFKRIDIMKGVLLLDKSPGAIVANGRSTPDEIGIALLAMNKGMKILVERFKAKLELEGDTSWRQDLLQASRRRLKIERTEEKRRRRNELKERKAIERKREEWLTKNRPKESNESGVKCGTNIAIVGDWKEEEIVIEENKSSETNKDTEDGTSPKPVCLQTKFDKGRRKFVPKLINSSETVKNVKTAVINSSKDRGPETKPRTKSNKEDGNKTAETTYVVDPFFITDSGENYFSSAVVERRNKPESDQDSGGLSKANGPQEKNKQKPKDRKSKDRQSEFKNNSNRAHFEARKKYVGEKDQSSHSITERADVKNTFKVNNKKEKYASSTSSERRKRTSHVDDKVSTPNVDSLSLHPSWIAKQRMKPTISKFEGKKIKFCDDDDE